MTLRLVDLTTPSTAIQDALARYDANDVAVAALGPEQSNLLENVQFEMKESNNRFVPELLAEAPPIMLNGPVSWMIRWIGSLTALRDQLGPNCLLITLVQGGGVRAAIHEINQVLDDEAYCTLVPAALGLVVNQTFEVIAADGNEAGFEIQTETPADASDSLHTLWRMAGPNSRQVSLESSSSESTAPLFLTAAQLAEMHPTQTLFLGKFALEGNQFATLVTKVTSELTLDRSILASLEAEASFVDTILEGGRLPTFCIKYKFPMVNAPQILRLLQGLTARPNQQTNIVLSLGAFEELLKVDGIAALFTHQIVAAIGNINPLPFLTWNTDSIDLKTLKPFTAGIRVALTMAAGDQGATAAILTGLENGALPLTVVGDAKNEIERYLQKFARKVASELAAARSPVQEMPLAQDPAKQAPLEVTMAEPEEQAPTDVPGVAPEEQEQPEVPVAAANEPLSDGSRNVVAPRRSTRRRRSSLGPTTNGVVNAPSSNHTKKRRASPNASGDGDDESNTADPAPKKKRRRTSIATPSWKRTAGRRLSRTPQA